MTTITPINPPPRVFTTEAQLRLQATNAVIRKLHSMGYSIMSCEHSPPSIQICPGSTRTTGPLLEKADGGWQVKPVNGERTKHVSIDGVNVWWIESSI